MRTRNCSSSNPRVYIGCQSARASRARCLLLPSLHAKAPPGSGATGTSTTPSAACPAPAPIPRGGFFPHSPRPQEVGLQPELLQCSDANRSSGIAQKLPRRGRDERAVGKRTGKPIAQDFREIPACPDPLNQPGGKGVTLCAQALLGHQFVVEQRGNTTSEPPEIFEAAEAAVGVTAALSSPPHVIIPIS